MANQKIRVFVKKGHVVIWNDVFSDEYSSLHWEVDGDRVSKRLDLLPADLWDETVYTQLPCFKVGGFVVPLAYGIRRRGPPRFYAEIRTPYITTLAVGRLTVWRGLDYPTRNEAAKVARARAKEYGLKTGAKSFWSPEH